VFVLLAVAAVVFEFSKEAQGWCISFGFTYLYTTPHMLIKGLFLFVRVMGAVSAMYFMTLTTPVHELIGVLRRFHVPAMFVELMYLIYRYIFILLETQRKMRISAESRLGFCDYRTSLKSFANIAGNLLIVSLQRAGNYYDAMESRCYDGALLFLEEKKPLDKRMVMRAVLFDSVLVLVAIALKLLWRN
jgi:cobalt/nickel transport system permease protein